MLRKWKALSGLLACVMLAACASNAAPPAREKMVESVVITFKQHPVSAEASVARLARQYGLVMQFERLLSPKSAVAVLNPPQPVSALHDLIQQIGTDAEVELIETDLLMQK